VQDVQSVVVDTNVFVAAGFNAASDAARVLASVRAGTLRMVWDDATRRETEYILGKIRACKESCVREVGRVFPSPPI
jgi:predicted nucleic acid-binding protein